jgi:hypothetical protein
VYLSDIDKHGTTVMKNAIRIGSMCAALALASANASATDVNLGTLGATDTTFGNTFYQSTTSFLDTYTFTIANSGAVSGTTSDGSYVNALLSFDKDVVLTALILGNTTFSTWNGVDLSIPYDGTTNTFSFTGLAAGTYSLAVTGYVTVGDNSSASYTGTIRTTASVASPAPEPADLALTAMGLTGVGLLLRRARKAAA